MKNFKSHFVFNRSERNGIFFLVCVILVLQGVYFFVDPSSEAEIPADKLEEVVRFQQQVDSLKKLAASEDTLRLYPFNPNFISDFKGYTLGMSVEEIDRLHAFREKDQWVNSALEFQEVTEISDSLLAEISPYFRFPEWRVRASGSPAESSVIVGKANFPGEEILKGKAEIRDLNTATPKDLEEVYGVGPVFSKRIVKYRRSIQGFQDEVQLHDVYGLSPEVVENILMQFRVLAPKEKRNINTISVLDLSQIPGFTYELAREVVAFRDVHRGIQSFEDLGKIKDFPVEKINRIQLYLTID